tara:strand:- start:127 stop:1239 length:1113 start_codon:yes stop_codon:yes gene_type:complete
LIFFYAGYWFLTQRLPLGRCLVVVGSIELVRVLFSGILRSNIDPLFNNSNFWHFLAINVLIFVPLALAFVCFVHLGGKFWRLMRAKIFESAGRVPITPATEANSPKKLENISIQRVEKNAGSESDPAFMAQNTESRRLNGVMRIRIVATALVFIASSGFAIVMVNEYVSRNSEAGRSLAKQQIALDAFLTDIERQNQCEEDEAFFAANPSSYTMGDDKNQSAFSAYEASEKLNKSLASIQSKLFLCGLQPTFTDDCEVYRSFADLYRSCSKRKQEQDEKQAAKEAECVSLREQETQVKTMIGRDKRYLEYSDRCFSPYSRVRYAREHSAQADHEMQKSILVGTGLAFGIPTVFWGIGSVLGWIIRGFREQ